MQLADSHCHLDQLDLSSYQGDLSLALLKANENAVRHFLCVCITLEEFPKVLKIAEAYPNVHASLGLHPNEITNDEPTLQTLIQQALHPKVVAIGETGLDYYRSEGDLTWQHNRFRNHIHAALKVNKPLIIHTRQAKEDTLTILKEENASKVGGVMHCFTEDWEMAKVALELGFYISISGIVTFNNAKIIQDVATRVPLDRLLIETDSPYLAPIPHRGKSNEPAYVRYVAEYIANLRHISLETLAESTTQNYFTLFNIKENYV